MLQSGHNIGLEWKQLKWQEKYKIKIDLSENQGNQKIDNNTNNIHKINWVTTLTC